MKYDLTVAYRIYPEISKIPPVYSENKYKLSKLCLESFKKSLGDLKVKMIVILDNCPHEYDDIFLDEFDTKDLELIHVSNLGNKKTFKKQVDILLKQSDSEFVFFAEDDYFYIKEIRMMLDIIKKGEADFITPYEHPEIYTDRHVIKKEIKIIGEQRYITAQHNCLTFMTTKETLRKTERIFNIYSEWFASDFVVFGCLTLGYDFFKYYKILLNHRNYNISNLKIFGSMFLFSWYRFILNKRYKLFMPIETIATHMESNFLSPCINWNNYFKNLK